jgi:hypothetical protein
MAPAGIAIALLAHGKENQAREEWQQALILCTALGVPEAGHVRASLAALEARHLACEA